MRTEDDIRAAFRTLARQAPDADAVLTKVRERLETSSASQRQGKRGRRPLAAVASAVAVMAVIGGSIALATSGHAPHQAASSPGPAVNSQPGPGGPLPPYFMALAPIGKSPLSKAVVNDTATGATLATVSPPRHFNTFVTVAGAADDRTFVLAAEYIGWKRSLSEPAVTLFLARYDPSRHRITLTALPIPAIPSDGRLNGLALSPDGSRLAVSTTLRRSEQLRVYSLTSGAAKVWRQPSVAPAFRLSWGRDGILAYNWDDSPRWGVWLLNTATAGGRLIANSRLAAAVPRGWAFIGGALLTPDGGTVVAAQTRFLTHLHHGINDEFAGYSAATGRKTWVAWPQHDAPEDLDWTSASGTVLVVQTFATNGPGMVYDVLSGNRLTPIPNTSQIGPIAF